MNKKTGSVVLSEKDKRIISQNKNICTDSHGKGCDFAPDNEINDLNKEYYFVGDWK